MASDSATGAEFSLGNVFSRGIGVITDNPVTVFGIAFLLGGLPSTAFSWFQQSITGEDMDTFQQIGSVAISLASVAVIVLLQVLVLGSLTRATIAYANGARTSIGESVGAGLAVVLPLVGLSIVMGLGIMVGMLLLIIPGIILYVMWSVAAPALVAEREGVMKALGRSRELTRGARWKVFGVLAILVVGYWIVSAIVGAAMFGAFGFDVAAVAAAAEEGLPIGWLLADLLLSTVLLTVWSTIIASLYVELRTWKEGPADQALAEIFA